MAHDDTIPHDYSPAFLTFIVATLNRDTELANALHSIEQAQVDNLVTETIVVDQGGSDTARKLCERYNAHYIASKTRGLSRARNIALTHATGHFVAFLDDDAELDKTYLSELHAFIEGNAVVDALCGRIINMDDRATSFSRHQGDEARDVNIRNFDIVLSSAFVVRRNILDKTAVFDEAFGVGSIWGASEESDLVLRLLRQGCVIKYQPNIIVFHPRADFASFAWHETASKSYSYGKGRGAMVRKHSHFSVLRKLYILCFGPLAGMGISLLSLKGKGFVRYGASFAGRLAGFVQYQPDFRGN